MRVRAVGATCDLYSGPVRVPEPRQVSFRVGEFIDLLDGRRVVLHDERGFTTSSSTGDAWRGLTAASIEDGVRMTVLPDGEDPVDGHPWEWLAGLAQSKGIDVSVADLQAVPYVVELSEAVHARLQT